MAIESGRIVSTTAKRAKVDQLSTPTPACAPVVPVAPPAWYPNTSGTLTSQYPSYEGEVRVVQTDEPGVCRMYVAVDFAPDPLVLQLEWKLCAPVSIRIDPRTGKPYDPLLAFYSPLAN